MCTTGLRSKSSSLVLIATILSRVLLGLSSACFIDCRQVKVVSRRTNARRRKPTPLHLLLRASTDTQQRKQLLTALIAKLVNIALIIRYCTVLCYHKAVRPTNTKVYIYSNNTEDDRLPTDKNLPSLGSFLCRLNSGTRTKCTTQCARHHRGSTDWTYAQHYHNALVSSSLFPTKTGHSR